MKTHRSVKGTLTTVVLISPIFGLSLYSQENKDNTLPADSIISVGYAKGNLKKISGSVELITEKQMNQIQIVNPIEAIQGRVAGLTVNKTGNSTAVMESVRLRGTTSITSGNSPLIIVDGVIGDMNLLTSVYPTDIESFTILKDASETAQYGSRGASGVINIVTKRGIKGKTSINYSGSFGISSVYKRLEMLDADEYRRVNRQLGHSIVDLGYNTNFQKAIEQNGIQQNHNIALYGGGEKSTYRVSLGYMEREGDIVNEKMKMFTSNMNLNQKLIENIIDCEIGLFGSVKRDRSLFDMQKTFYSAAAFNPTFPAGKNSSGGWDNLTTASQITNPLAWMEVDNRNANSYFSAHAKLNINILRDLKLILFGSYTYNNSEDNQYLPTTVWAYGQAYRGIRNSESLLGNIMLTFNRQKGKHFIDLLALGELSKDIYSGFHTTVTNFSSNNMGFHNLQAGALRPWEGTASYYEEPKLVSFLGRMNYTYDDRYILTVNARTDASSKFGKNNKWGFFPSVSAAWNVTGEEFMRGIDIVNNLKIRVGYGLAGNQGGIDSYTTMATARPYGVVPVGNSPMVTFESLKNTNPNLKWEVKSTLNAGADLGMFSNRLLFSINVYKSRTSDMLYNYNVSVPPFTYNKLLANIGSMQNNGVEISIGGTPLRTRDMELSINANITYQQNKLLSLSGMYEGNNISAAEYTAIAGLDGAGFHGGYNNNIVYQIVGQPLGVFYLPKCNGLKSDGNGGYVYDIADLNGGGVNIEDGEDRYIAGQAIPKYLLGSNISFRYKRFDVSLQINGAFGHKIYNGTALTYMNINNLPDYNVMTDAPERMIKDQTATDYWLENGNYVNFDYFTIGWRPRLKNGWLVKNMRLALTVNNLATISAYSGLTPLINSSNADSTLGVDDKRNYPVSRTYTLSLSVNF